MQDITVGIREAKINLSRLLSKVESGAVVTITHRGTPVARLTRIPASALSLEDRLHELERRGLIEPARSTKAKNLPPPMPLPEGLAQVFLGDDREGRIQR